MPEVRIVDNTGTDLGTATNPLEVSAPAAGFEVTQGTAADLQTEPIQDTPADCKVEACGNPDKNDAATTMLNAATVNAGASSAEGDCTALDLSNYDGAALEVGVTFPSGSTGALDVQIRYSMDGTNYSDEDDDFFQVAASAGNTVHRVRPVADADVIRYIKVIVKNNDGTKNYTVTVKGYPVNSKTSAA